MHFKREEIERAVKAKGYAWFDTGAYNVNIIGVRNSLTKYYVTNKFDDWITISYLNTTCLLYTSPSPRD